MPAAYPDPVGAQLPNGESNRAFWRWIEPDNGFGVNGAPNNPLTGATLAGDEVNATLNRAINNNALPLGGPSTCVWNAKTHCGPNDEIFGWHWPCGEGFAARRWQLACEQVVESRRVADVRRGDISGEMLIADRANNLLARTPVVDPTFLAAMFAAGFHADLG